MKLVALIFALVMPLSSLAQDQHVPKQVLDDFARDLSQLNEVVLEAQRLQNAQAPRTPQAGSGVSTITITNTSAAVHAGASDSSTTIDKVLKGKTLPVIDKVGDWYAIELPKSSEGLGAGWVKAADAVPSSTAGWSIPSLLDPAKFLIDKAMELKQKWANNNYISITGFSISTTPPNLTVDFKFE